jgi:hypothetical protein
MTTRLAVRGRTGVAHRCAGGRTYKSRRKETRMKTRDVIVAAALVCCIGIVALPAIAGGLVSQPQPAQTLWVQPRPAQTLWVQPQPAQTLWVQPRPAQTLWVQPRPAQTLWVQPRPAQTLWVQPRPAQTLTWNAPSPSSSCGLQCQTAEASRVKESLESRGGLLTSITLFVGYFLGIDY